MKKLLLIFSFVLVTYFANAQKLFKSKDAITGKTSIVGMVSLGTQLEMNGQNLIFAKRDDKLYITFFWLLSGKDGEVFNLYALDKTSLIIKIDNDSILRLKPDLKESKVSVTSNLSSFSFTSEVSAEMMAFFKTNAVTAIRIANDGDNGYDVKFSEKFKKEVPKAVNYVLSEVTSINK